MSKQTKAQRLADELEQDPITGRLGFVSVAAAELRMLEAENESLRQQNTMLDAKLAEIEAALIATERQVEILSHLLSMRRREAAQPAQELLTCSVCGVDTQDPWHYSDGSSHERALYLFGK